MLRNKKHSVQDAHFSGQTHKCDRKFIAWEYYRVDNETRICYYVIIREIYRIRYEEGGQT